MSAQDDMAAASKMVEDFLAGLGDPPHLVSIVLNDEPTESGNSQCMVTTHVSGTIKLPHAGLMLGSILAQLADNDPHKLLEIIRLAHQSALQVMASTNPGSHSSTVNPELN